MTGQQWQQQTKVSCAAGSVIRNLDHVHAGLGGGAAEQMIPDS